MESNEKRAGRLEYALRELFCKQIVYDLREFLDKQIVYDLRELVHSRIVYNLRELVHSRLYTRLRESLLAAGHIQDCVRACSPQVIYKTACMVRQNPPSRRRGGALDKRN